MTAITTAGGNNVLGGGALINEQWVLSAAHVFKMPFEYLRVIVGESDIKRWQEKNFELREIENVFVHPNWTGEWQMHNDIALIKLKKQVPKMVALPACLPTKTFTEYGLLIGAGWGKTSGDSTTQSKLLDVELVKRNCSAWTSFNTGPSQICAGEVGKDTCPGDSGTPLMTQKMGYLYAVGVLSYGGEPCGTTQYPGVFTKVSYYIDWIKEVVNNNVCHGVLR